MPLSVHDVPHAEVESVILQPNSEVEALENSQPSYAIDEPLPPGSVAHETDALKKIDTRNVRQEVRREPSNHRTPSRRTHEPVSASSYQIRQTNGSRRHSTQIFDEIESDSESFRQRQQMYSAKRMRLDRTAPERLSSPCDPPGSTGDKSGGHFLIPSTPLSRQNGSRIISGELSVLHKPQDATPFDPQRTASHSQSKNLGSGFQHLPQSRSVQAAQGQNPQTLVPAKSSGEDSTNDEIQHEPRPLSQCTTTWSQASDSFPKNCSHLDVEHPIKKALSEGRKPDFSSLTNAENSSDDKENHRSLQTQRVERMAQKVGGQQNRQTLGECRVEKQRSPTNAVEKQGELDGVEEASSTAVQEALQGGIEEKTTPETISEEEKSCAEQLEEATKTSIDSRDESHTGVLAATTENQPVVNKREENMRSSRDRQSKEKTLSEQAQQMMLKADGAMQLQVEKLQKQKTPTSASKGSTIKTPKSTKYPPRTDEQKAARKQREAKKKAKPRKAVETKGTLNWADQLFEESSVGVRQNSENIDTDTEEDKMLKTSTKSKPSTRAIEKPNISSAEIAHSSPTPSEASILSRNRKSLTPALPNTSTTKSPHKASLLSSSPLASGPSASVDTPLRSALKQNQTPSTLRRSVSFVNDHGDNDRARTADIFSSSSASHARPMKSLVELNNELALTSMPAGISTAPFGELPISKTARQSIDKKEMVQQKLNVIRDKKLKGRMPDPPISSRSTPEREGKSLFSDCSSVSDFSSDEDLGNGNAEAGPSSRKKSVRGVQLRQNSAVKTPTPVTPVDPALEKIRPIRGTSESPRPALRLKSVSDPLSPSRSTSRSPALRMSETVSMTSGSTSSSESGSGSDSDSDSIDSHESPAAKTFNNATSGTPLDAKIHDIGKSVKGERQSSPNSEVFCTGNYNNHVNNKAVQQSQLNRAEPASAQSTSNTSQDDENNRADKGNPWLSTRDRLLNSTHPTPFKYPTFTNFRMMAEATTPEEEAVALAAPQNPALLQEDEDDSSSSSSDESTSNSDEESSQKGSKSKSGMFRAVRSLVNNYQRFRAGK